MSRIVVIAASPASSAAVDDLRRDHDVVLVTTGGVPADHALVLRPLPGIVRRLIALAWASAAGRNLVRVTPLDMSRRLWRAAHRDDSLRTLVRSADAVVAADRDAVLTVWKMSRRRAYGTDWVAAYGATAARYLLAR